MNADRAINKSTLFSFLFSHWKRLFQYTRVYRNNLDTAATVNLLIMVYYRPWNGCSGSQFHPAHTVCPVLRFTKPTVSSTTACSKCDNWHRFFKMASQSLCLVQRNPESSVLAPLGQQWCFHHSLWYGLFVVYMCPLSARGSLYLSQILKNKNNAHILYISSKTNAKAIDSSFWIFHTRCKLLCISSQVYAFSSLKYPWHAGNIFPMLKSGRFPGTSNPGAFGALAFVSSWFRNGLHFACGLCWKVTSAKAFLVDLTVLGSSVSVRWQPCPCDTRSDSSFSEMRWSTQEFTQIPSSINRTKQSQ